ncbi:CPBP family intramembrane glutamic endopeptidase [Patescibacteria group bacterium]
MTKKTSVKLLAKSKSLEPIFQLWGWILLTWSLYRYFVRFPEWADELVFKPLIFVLPVVFYVVKKEKRRLSSLGLTTKNFFNALYIGIGFGMLFAIEGVVVNIFKNGQLVITPLEVFSEYGMLALFGLSIFTAFSEELLNRGFLFKRIHEKTENLVYASLIASVLFILLHIPILVTTTKIQGGILLLFFATNMMLSLINCFLFASTGTLLAPILVHIFWNMAVSIYL